MIIFDLLNRTQFILNLYHLFMKSATKVQNVYRPYIPIASRDSAVPTFFVVLPQAELPCVSCIF